MKIQDSQEDQEASAEGYCNVRNLSSVRIISFTLDSSICGLIFKLG